MCFHKKDIVQFMTGVLFRALCGYHKWKYEAAGGYYFGGGMNECIYDRQDS